MKKIIIICILAGLFSILSISQTEKTEINTNNPKASNNEIDNAFLLHGNFTSTYLDYTTLKFGSYYTQGQKLYNFQTRPTLQGNNLTHIKTEITLNDIYWQKYATYQDNAHIATPTSPLQYYVIPDPDVQTDQIALKPNTNSITTFTVRSMTNAITITELKLKPNNYRIGSKVYNGTQFIPEWVSNASWVLGGQTWYYYNYRFNQTYFTYYDPNEILYCRTNENFYYNISFKFTGSPVDFYCYMETDYKQQYMPSELDMQLNNKPIQNTGINSGYIEFDEYQDTLYFDSNIDPASSNVHLRFEFFTQTYLTYYSNLSIINEYLLFFDEQLRSSCNIDFYDFDTNITYFDAFFNTETIPLVSPITIEPDEFINIMLLLDQTIYIGLTEISFNQIENITTNENCRFNQTLQPNRDFDSFLLQTRYNATLEHVYFNGIEISFIQFNQSIYYINQSASTTDEFSAIWLIDPNFNISYEVISEANDETEIEISYSADLNITNTTLLCELPRYYLNWTLQASQNENRIISIPNIDFLNVEQTLSITGNFANPSLVSYSSYVFNTDTIFSQYFDEYIEFNAYISFPDQNHAFRLPFGDNWNVDKVYQGSTSYEIENTDIIYTEKDPTITTCYLRFFANPINSFETLEFDTYIELRIDCSIPLENAILLFWINIAESYRIRDSRVLELAEMEDTDYYSMQISLEEGMNVIQIPIQRFQPSRLGTYIFLFLGIAGLVGLYFYDKRRKEKKNEPK